MAYDIAIRGGMVVDGTGAEPVRADVGIAGGVITAIGKLEGMASREIDAAGLTVTPGFVDIHTHLDAQIGWDPDCTPVSWHGVTTALLGNCGVTFAPCRPADKELLAGMMETVEDIPRAAILHGLPWTWEDYGGYLDAIETLKPGINIAGLVGHSAVRFYVMGERAVEEQATEEERRRMADVVAQSIDRGAAGFSTNRFAPHRLPDGRSIPGTFADPQELFRDPGYDPFKDFLPITELGSSPNVILVPPFSSVTSLASLVAKAKVDKGKLNVINPGQGSTPHLTAELLQLRTGIEIENIPYNGAGPAIQALLANTAPVGITALPPAHAHIRSGALRALAITAEKRWFDLPDVPTAEEQGISGLVSETFQGMYAAAGTPPAIVERVARDTLDVLKDPATIDKLRGVGFDVRASGPDGLARRVAKEVPMWRDIIVQSRIELQ